MHSYHGVVVIAGCSGVGSLAWRGRVSGCEVRLDARHLVRSLRGGGRCPAVILGSDCAAGGPSWRRWTGCWLRCGPVRAGCWSCAARRESARPSWLTPDPAQRGARALAAARAKFAAAAPDAAYELLAMAELGRLDELQRAELARLRAQMAFAERRGSDAAKLLLDAAKKLGSLDSGLGRETYLEALGAAISAGRLGRGLTVRQAAEAARTAAPPAPQPPRPLDLLLDGAATRLTEGYVAGVPPLRRALDALGRHGGRSEAGIMGWLPLAAIAPELWDDATWHELTARAVGLAR